MTRLHRFCCRAYLLGIFISPFILHIKGLAQTQTFDNYFKQGQEKIQQKDYRRAVIDFTIAIEIEPRLEGYLERAKAYQLNQDFKKAIRDYDEALNLTGENAILLNNRGNLKDQINAPLEAINDYDRAILLDSTYTHAYYNRAIAKYNIQDFNGSQDDFQKVLQFSPQDAMAYLGLGLCAYQLDDQSSACVHFEQAMKISPDIAEAYLKKYCP